jgi:hypothetical protein
VDEVVLGAANQAGEDNRNVARMAALLAGFPDSVPGFTINRLCASGLTAVVTSRQMIAVDDAGLVGGRWFRVDDACALGDGEAAPRVGQARSRVRHFDRLAIPNPRFSEDTTLSVGELTQDEGPRADTSTAGPGT